jgi:CAAX prenyl protease-like protein
LIWQRLRCWLDRNPTVRYVLPFGLFLVFLWLSGLVSVSPAWDAPIRVLVVGAACLVCWPRAHPVKPTVPWKSVLIGIAVFALWIAPDLIYKNYRELAPFNNVLIGHVHSSMPAESLISPWALSWRFARAVLIVPVVEELFWRAWLMRWLIDTSFERVPLGTYQRNSFLIVAVLFACEHGPYWDVGLLTGFIYNWWMVRTKSLSDCILMHAVTNACLSAYVIATAHWEYWQ